jgi:Tfp pilus assembly protein PilV
VTLPELLIVCVTLLALAGIAARALLERDTRRAQHQRELAMHERAVTAPVAELADAVEQLATAAGALERVAGAAGPTRVGHRVTVHTKRPTTGRSSGSSSATTPTGSPSRTPSTSPRGGRPLPGRQDIARDDIAWIDVHAHVAPAPDHAPAEA